MTLFGRTVVWPVSTGDWVVLVGFFSMGSLLILSLPFIGRLRSLPRHLWLVLIGFSGLLLILSSRMLLAGELVFANQVARVVFFLGCLAFSIFQYRKNRG